MSYRVSFPQELVEKRFAGLVDLMDQLQKKKGDTYKDAWCRRGFVMGPHNNMARKWDRAENLVNMMRVTDTHLVADGNVESQAETIIDLAIYSVLSLLWLTVFAPDMVVNAFRKEGIEVPQHLLGNNDPDYRVTVTE